MNRRTVLMASTMLVAPAFAQAAPCPSELAGTVRDRLAGFGFNLSSRSIRRGVVMAGLSAAVLPVAVAAGTGATVVAVAGIAVVTAAPVIIQTKDNALEVLRAALDDSI